MHIPIISYAAAARFSSNYMVPILSLNHIEPLFAHFNCCCTKIMHLCCCDMPGQKKKSILEDNSRNRVIRIHTEYVVNDVYTCISS